MKVHTDNRGRLYEIPKVLGTTFISHTFPGVRRGDHYHLLKTEKFTIISGEANLYARDRESGYIVKIPLLESFVVPPNTVHAIENIGETELIILVQSDIEFDPEHPDTYPEIV